MKSSLHRPHYVIHQTIRVHDSFSLCFWLPSNSIYVAELAAPRCIKHGGTMEWLSGLCGLHQCNSSIHSGQSAFSQPACFIWLFMGMQEWLVGLSRGERPLHELGDAGPTSSSRKPKPHAFHTHHQPGLVIPALSSPSSPSPPTFVLSWRWNNGGEGQGVRVVEGMGKRGEVRGEEGMAWAMRG